MQGIIFAELEKFTVATFGREAWASIASDAGVPQSHYLSSTTYPDAELVALVGSAAAISGIPAQDLLQKFGEFIVPDLVTVFGAFIKPGWKALDLLENTESVTHRAVRLQDANATPPQLQITRPDPNEVVILYSSPRKLCAVAKGIIRGIAAHYNEPLQIEERGCMLAGATRCSLHVMRT